MFLDKDSIVINNVSMGQYITEAKFSYNKLWGEDSGRNLNGDMVATLLGIFPKIILTFRKLTKSEMEIIAPILDSSRQNVTYYDPVKKKKITITTYTGDYEFLDRKMIGTTRKNSSFTCSFIATKKRT